jgi:WD40 repeat protein
VAFSPLANSLISGSDDRTIKLWDLLIAAQRTKLFAA